MPPLATEHLERARRLLTHEGASGDVAADYAEAAGRVYEKLDAELASLLGGLGTEALFARAVRLAQARHAFLADLASPQHAATQLRSCLRQYAPDVAMDAAATLFGTYLSLITTFVGGRLTNQVLRKAWPTLDEKASPENGS